LGKKSNLKQAMKTQRKCRRTSVLFL